MNSLKSSGLLSSKWHDDLTKEIDSILARELEKISLAIDDSNNDNDLKLLWYHFDRLHILQAVNDGRYTTNNPKMSENTVVTLNN